MCPGHNFHEEIRRKWSTPKLVDRDFHRVGGVTDITGGNDDA